MNVILAWVAAMASSAFVKAVLQRALIALGIGFASYSGFNAIYSLVLSKVQAGVGGLAADVLSLLTIAGFDRALSVVLSAVAAKLVLRGVSAAGVVTKMYNIGGGPPVVLS